MTTKSVMYPICCIVNFKAMSQWQMYGTSDEEISLNATKVLFVGAMMVCYQRRSDEVRYKTLVVWFHPKDTFMP